MVIIYNTVRSTVNDSPWPMQSHYYSNHPSLLLPQNANYSAPTDHYPVVSACHTESSGFSDGSPTTGYPDHEYPYFFDRRGTSINALSSPSVLPAMNHNATGLSETGDLSVALANVYAEDTLAYHQSWNLPSSHGHARLAESTALGSDFSFKNASYSGPALSPTPKLPTPSEMAILMRPNSRQSPSELPPKLPPVPLHAVGTDLVSTLPPPEEELTLARERKHACSMCHKRCV
ncbi:hypothetical protein GYMLUDRAFT_498211 [Collybiopsis luxurians FD-317 M1]|uniref:Uncharacterized protein n=1 Tax=Collybiopsis luxurians FD-317 M1 TaxID=944289 RepID=A0A0D0CIA9_9AGAR|nr:hypothetical protein GYMLUDRAFT_498211 [Collybiopsis luxurians FD-317 M1]